MKIKFHKSFIKDYRRLDNKIKKVLKDRLELFYQNPYHIKLNNHPLQGKWKNYKSINITGNFRAVYKTVNDKTAIFIACGTHSKLYR